MTTAPAPVIDKALQAELAAAVEAGFERQLAFTQALVGCPSVRGAEQTAQDLMAAELAARGYAVDRWTLDADALAAHPGGAPVVEVDYGSLTNVVATHQPRTGSGHSLILNGHIDVVPTGPESLWRHPPFTPRVVDGWLYGRGAGDMKSGLVAGIAALDALKAIGRQPAGRLHIESVVEEESTGNGTLACSLRGYRADAAIIPEPTGERLVRANVGVLWFRIEVGGRPAHVMEAQIGSNAILASFRLAQALKELEVMWNEARRLERWFRDVPHPIHINIGRIKGGEWPSSVAATCTLDCRAGFYPSVDPDDAFTEIEKAIQQACRRDPFLAEHPPVIRRIGFQARGYVQEPGSDAERMLAASHQAVVENKLADTVMSAYLDARVFSLYDDIPALTYGALGCDFHAFDERVELASLRRVTLVLALFIAGWCGTEPV